MNKKGSRNITKFLLSPSFIYFVIWFFILFLLSLKIIIFPELGHSFYLALGMNFLGLLLGTSQAMLMQQKLCKCQIVNNTKDFFTWVKVNKNLLQKARRLLCFIAAIGVIFIYLKVFSQVTIIQFFLQQAYVKSKVKRSIFGTYLSMCAYVALPVSACLDYEAKKFLKYSKFPSILAGLYSISYWGRFPLLVAVIILSSSKILIFLLEKQIKDFLCYKKGMIAKGIICGIIGFLIVFLFMSWTIELRVAEYGAGYDPYKNLYKENNLTKILKAISPLCGSFRAITITYSYFTASIPTLAYWTSMDSEYGLGQASFPYFYRLMNKIGLIDKPVLMGDRVVGRGLQLPSFPGYLYIDFGLVGVLVFSYALGLLSMCLYERFLSRPSLSRLSYLSIIYIIVVFSPITNAIAQTMFVIILFGFVVINYFLKRNSKRIYTKTNKRL